MLGVTSFFDTVQNFILFELLVSRWQCLFNLKETCYLWALLKHLRSRDEPVDLRFEKWTEWKNGVFNPKKIYINVVIKKKKKKAKKNHDAKPLCSSWS